METMERSMKTAPSSMTGTGSKGNDKSKCSDSTGSTNTGGKIHSLVVNKRKATASIQSSLGIIRNSLLCPICNLIMKDPSTLPCSHSFCKACISDHTRNSWTCPLPNCQLPVSNRGGSKSYISTNPQLSSVISSLQNIVSSLNSASDEWWKQHNRQQQQPKQASSPSPHRLHPISSPDNNGESVKNSHKNKSNHKNSTIFDDIEIETPPIKKQKFGNNDSNSQCSGSTTTNDDDSTNDDCNENHNDNDRNIPNKNGDNSDQGNLNDDNAVDDDDDKTQCYVFDDDGEETQQAFSIDDQPYSMIEIDNDDSGSTTTENDSEQNNTENDKGGGGSEDNNTGNTTQKDKTLIEVVNHDSFIESPPVFPSDDQNQVMKRTRARTCSKPPTDSPKKIKQATTTLNKSCAIPLGTSPKLSPIALVPSQHSINNSIDNVEENYENLDDIQSQKQTDLSFTVRNYSENNFGQQQQHQQEQVQGSAVSFMNIFNKLLQKIDSAHGEEQLSCNNGLLQDYCIYLIGDFDDYFSRALTSTSRKYDQHNGQLKGQGQQPGFTRGRICLLLNLCGAQVKDVCSVKNTAITSTKKSQSYVIVVPDTNPTTECREQIQYFLQSQKGNRRSNRRRDDSFVVVSCQWIFDSINEFMVRDYDDYSVKD